MPIHPAFSSNDSSIFISSNQHILRCINQTTLKSIRLGSPLNRSAAEATNLFSSIRTKMPSTQQPNCQRSNRTSQPCIFANAVVSSPPAIQEKSLAFRKRFLVNSKPTRLKVEQSGKGRIYSCSPTPSTPPTKKSLLFLTDWELGFCRKPPASNAESSDSFVRF